MTSMFWIHSVQLHTSLRMRVVSLAHAGAEITRGIDGG
jgi:hypothetical protein